jgi:hypothetical protein
MIIGFSFEASWEGRDWARLMGEQLPLSDEHRPLNGDGSLEMLGWPNTFYG